MKIFLRTLAWSALIIILVVTISPLRDRPDTLDSPAVDRAGVYFVLGLLFSLAYVHSGKFALSVVVFAAVGFEMAQVFIPDRHARPADAAIKMIGGALGFATGWALVKADELRRRTTKRLRARDPRHEQQRSGRRSSERSP